MADKFWDLVNAQCDELESAKSADDVMRILSPERNPYGPDWDGACEEGFFAGSGGDRSLIGSLYRAGWKQVWIKAPYYYTMQAPNGDLITYIEGDVKRGKVHGMPLAAVTFEGKTDEEWHDMPGTGQDND